MGAINWSRYFLSLVVTWLNRPSSRVDLEDSPFADVWRLCETDTDRQTLQELAKLDAKTRKFLTMYKMHHPKSDVDRLYLPITEGGRGLIQQQLSIPTSQPLSVLINTSRRRRTSTSTLSKTMTAGNPCTPSADSQWSSFAGTGSALNTTWRRWDKHHLCPQNKGQGQGQTPGLLTAQVQGEIKSTPWQIPTIGETGWRGPR